MKYKLSLYFQVNYFVILIIKTLSTENFPKKVEKCSIIKRLLMFVIGIKVSRLNYQNLVYTNYYFLNVKVI